MIEAVALTYSVLAAFVLSSASRNRRAGRPHAGVLVRYGALLMSMSLTLSGLLFALAGKIAIFG